MADPDLKLQLNGWFNRDVYVNAEKINAVIALYEKIGVKDVCLNKMKECCDRGLEYLSSVNIPEERKSELKNIALKLLNRQV